MPIKNVLIQPAYKLQIDLNNISSDSFENIAIASMAHLLFFSSNIISILVFFLFDTTMNSDDPNLCNEGYKCYLTKLGSDLSFNLCKFKLSSYDIENIIGIDEKIVCYKN